MTGPEAALRRLAGNRGCRLVKSRRRKPGSGDYGLYGLTDAVTGRQVFGFGGSGLTASPEEIESFLRGTTAATWKNSRWRHAGQGQARPLASRGAGSGTGAGKA